MAALWATIAAALKLVVHARGSLVILAIAIEITGLLTMTNRWRLLLAAIGARVRYLDVALAYSAGVFVCNVTPARTIGGDATRGALIGRKSQAPRKLIAASVVYDRATDVIGILALAVLSVPTLRRSGSARIAAAVLAGVACALAIPSFRRAVWLRIRRWHDELVGVPLGPVAAAVGVSAVAVWLQDAARIMAICAAFDVGVSPSQAATLTLVRLTSTIIPVPAGIGVADGAMVAGLLWFGVPADVSAAIAILERAILYGWSTLLGAIAIMILGGTRLLKSLGKS